ncbi:MAG: M4 family metallopeptidase [Bacteroidia bacterium]
MLTSFRLAKMAMLLSCFSVAPAIIAQNSELKLGNAQVAGYSPETNLPNFIRFAAGQEISQDQFENWAMYALNLDGAMSLKAYKTEKDNFGFIHTRFHQYYNSVLIEGTSLITHAKNGRLVSVNGDFIQDTKAATTVSLSEKAALQKALGKVNAKRYKWENKDHENALKTAFNDPGFGFFPKGELVIVQKNGENYSAASTRLAYKFNIYAEEPLYRAYIYVDANSGEIINEKNLICTIDVAGTANTKYSGTQTITCDNYGTGQYRLRETGRGTGIETYNLNNSMTYTNTDFTNASSTWNVTGTNQAAGDAHWGAEMTYDYYLQNHNRNSIDDNGYKLLNYVHYSTNYANAFWDGTEMTYGDGSSTQGFTIMTALDVCGHEITHGVVENTANLGNGEAGALNEGFADIFGTTIERFARPAQNDWLIGADITTNGQGLRNMSNPSLMQQPDTYQGTNWDAGGEVHTNNGPCIYWYYLMCQGGTGTNDNNNTYTVNPIGMTDAAQIAYRGLTTYFTTNTNYASARNYTIQAAIDLFGNCSQQVITCTNAWYAVGVGSQYSASGVITSFSAAQTSSCALPVSVPFNNTSQSGLTYTWDFGDGTTSNAVSPTHTYTQAGNYTVKLMATGCSSTTDSTIMTNYISITPPSSPVTTGAARCGAGTLSLSAAGGGTLNWYDGSGTLVNTGTSFTTPSLNASTTYNVSSSVAQTPVTGGPATNTGVGGGGYLNYSHYLVFDVSSPLTIQTVDIYAQATGSRTVQLQDNTGSVIATKTVTATVVGKNTVTLNLHVNSGTGYRLVATGATINLYRNNAGAVYPYTIGSLVSITGTDVTATNPAYYYYFYNWTVLKDPCVSALTPVTATINTGVGNVTVNSATVCAGDSITLTASGAASYSWNTGATTSSITVAPANTSTYVVTGTASGCSSASDTSTVTVNPLPSVSFILSDTTVCLNNGPEVLNATPAGGTFSGTAVSGNSFDPAVSGTGIFEITYVYTDGNTCSATTSDSISVDACTGMTQYADNQLLLFPNPANEEVAIKSAGAVTLRMFDQTGRLVLETSSGQNTGDLRIATSSYAEGIYQLNITIGEKVIRKRLLIQH